MRLTPHDRTLLQHASDLRHGTIQVGPLADKLLAEHHLGLTAFFQQLNRLRRNPQAAEEFPLTVAWLNNLAARNRPRAAA